MAKWADKTIEKPKEPFKQKLPFVNTYNDYGFDYNNSMYSISEEQRDFRKHIQYEIIMEELKTQNILGQHITDEADRTIQEVNDNTDTRSEEIKAHVVERTTYVINTLTPKIETVERKVEAVNTNVTTVSGKVDTNKNLLDNIWAKVQTFKNALIG